MSRNVLCAKGTNDYNHGNGSAGGGTPDTQTEAATELIINRLAVIDMLQTGELDKADTIITLPERMFLYENIFDNVEVVDYNEHREIQQKVNVDIVMGNYWQTLDYKPFYKHYERDKDLIHNITYHDHILNEKLDNILVVIPRLKNSDTRRNLDVQYWKDFVLKQRNKVEKIIIFGKGTEDFEDIASNVTYVDTLQEYYSWIHHKACKNVVSTVSGPCHYIQHFGNTNGDTTLTMIDTHGLCSKHGTDPSYFDPCINFTKVKLNIISGETPTPHQLGSHIWE